MKTRSGLSTSQPQGDKSKKPPKKIASAPTGGRVPSTQQFSRKRRVLHTSSSSSDSSDEVKRRDDSARLLHSLRSRNPPKKVASAPMGGKDLGTQELSRKRRVLQLSSSSSDLSDEVKRRDGSASRLHSLKGRKSGTEQLQPLKKRYLHFRIPSLIAKDKLKWGKKKRSIHLSTELVPDAAGGSATSSGDSGILALIKELSEDKSKYRMPTSDVGRITAELIKSEVAHSKLKGDEVIRTVDYRGMFSIEKSSLLEVLSKNVDQLVRLASNSDLLWLQDNESGSETLDYDKFEYLYPSDRRYNTSTWPTIETSRDNAVFSVNSTDLIECFLNASKWSLLFSGVVARAYDLGTVSGRENCSDGLVKLMFAEVQVATPFVPSREFIFLRYGKKMDEKKFVVLDMSLDLVDNGIDPSVFKCRKMPSGFLIEDVGEGTKITMVEHGVFGEITVPEMYRSTVLSGRAFCAKRWLITLQKQMERLTTCVNICASKDAMLPQSVDPIFLKLASRLTRGLLKCLCGSEHNTWLEIHKSGEDIRVRARKGLREAGEPEGLIACAVVSTTLPICAQTLFNYLRDAPKLSAVLGMVSNKKMRNMIKTPDYSMTVYVNNSTMDDYWPLKRV